MSALPEWAQKIAPVDMDGAAVLLGVSRRFLVDVIKAHPHYESRGVRKVFYPEHIAQLRDALCQDSNSKTEMITGSGMPLALSEESAFDEALRLATRKKPKRQGHFSKRGFGKVIPMAKKP